MPLQGMSHNGKHPYSIMCAMECMPELMILIHEYVNMMNVANQEFCVLENS